MRPDFRNIITPIDPCRRSPSKEFVGVLPVLSHKSVIDIRLNYAFQPALNIGLGAALYGQPKLQAKALPLVAYLFD